METTELALKFGLIGWRGELDDPTLFEWLSKKYKVTVKETSFLNTYLLLFKDCILCQYYGLELEGRIADVILPEILKLWKCKEGVLEGPSIENYEEPETEWT